MKTTIIFTIFSLSTKILLSQVTGLPYAIPSIKNYNILVEDQITYGFHVGGLSAPILDDKILNSNNFGLNGIFKAIDVNITLTSQLPTPYTITATDLNQYDLLIVTFAENISFTNTELNIIYDWVTNQGGALIVFEDSQGHSSIGTFFGLTHGGFYAITPLENPNGTFIIDDPNHPIFNNVFGTVNILGNYSWIGHYDMPLPNDFTMLAHDSTLDATIVSYNNGKALFFTDEGPINNSFLSPGNGITTPADVFFGNLISWAFF
jgi:hypothetical protein